MAHSVLATGVPGFDTFPGNGAFPNGSILLRLNDGLILFVTAAGCFVGVLLSNDANGGGGSTKI